MVRLFIGVLIPEEVKSDIVSLQESMSRMPMRAKIVEPQNLHISMSFLGEVRDDVGRICGSLDTVCSNAKRFTVKISGVSFIPNDRFMRVISLGCSSPMGELEALRRAVVNSVGGESHSAHLTLARVREMVDRDFVLRNLRDNDLEKYFEVAELSVVRSYISRTGPSYQTLHKSKLQ